MCRRSILSVGWGGRMMWRRFVFFLLARMRSEYLEYVVLTLLLLID